MSIKWVNPGARAVRILERDKANPGPEQWLTVEPVQPVPDFMGPLRFRLSELLDAEVEALETWYDQLRPFDYLTGTCTDSLGRRIRVSGHVSAVRLKRVEAPALVQLVGIPKPFETFHQDRLFLTDDEAIAFLAREKNYSTRRQKP